MSPQGLALAIILVTLGVVIAALVVCALWDAVRDAKGWV